jgi:hypothetical protein
MDERTKSWTAGASRGSRQLDDLDRATGRAVAVCTRTLGICAVSIVVDRSCRHRSYSAMRSSTANMSPSLTIKSSRRKPSVETAFK